MSVRSRSVLSALLFVSLALATDIGCAPRAPAAVERPPAPGAAPSEGAVRVRLLAFNDFHGVIEPPAGSAGRARVRDPERPGAVVEVEVGGAAFLAAHLRALVAEDPAHTIVVAAGDLVGASPLVSAAFHDEPAVAALNAIGLAFSAVGNHELDEGLAELRRIQSGGCHPTDGCFDPGGFGGAAWEYLAANLVDGASGELVFPAWRERTFGAVRVAFVGVAPQDSPWGGGLVARDEADAVNALVPAIRARGIEAIVVLLHEGGFARGLPDECRDLTGPVVDIVARLDPAVDVVLTGHTHGAYVCEPGGRLVTSAGAAGRLVTDVELWIDPRTGDVTARRAHTRPVTRTVAGDPGVAAIVERWRGLVAPVAGRVVGRLAPGVDLSRRPDAAGESALGAVIADAQLAATDGPGEGGAQLALMNPGGIRTDLEYGLVYGSEAPGELTYGEVFAVQPFANQLVTVTLSGAQLLDLLREQWCREGQDRDTGSSVLQVSEGFSYRWDDRRPACGDRLDAASVRLHGQPLDPTGRYRVTVNSYLASAGDDFPTLAEGTERVTASGLDLDALLAWLAARPVVTAPEAGRIRIERRP